MRSGVAVRRLRAVGYDGAVSLTGGLDAWRAAGKPVAGTGGFTKGQLDRYDRQIKMPDIGVPGQQRLADAVVAVVGAGGLGSPVLSYLAAAGVGTLRVIDPDVVEISNLQRQPIYGTSDAGREKALSAAAALGELNPDVVIEAITDELTAENATSLLAGVSVVIDATDRFAARYAINDAAVRLGVPLVSGSVYRWEGQVMTAMPEGPCYRCAFPEPPDSDVVLDCALTGVIGPVVGTVGAMQATEAIQLIATDRTAHAGGLTVFDGRTGSTLRVRIERRADCPACGTP